MVVGLLRAALVYAAQFVVFLVDSAFPRVWIRTSPALDLGLAKGKTVVLTGATSGIGVSTGRKLATHGAKLVVGVRNTDAAARMVAEWKQQAPHVHVEVYHLDLTSLQSVRKFAEEVTKAHSKVDVLINNAGVLGVGRSERHVTNEGFEEHLGVNFLAPFLLTALLLPLVERAEGHGRVVNLISSTYRVGRLRLNDLNFRHARDFRAYTAYAQSKLALAMATVELQARLPRSSTTLAFAADPGVIHTKIVRDLPPWVLRAYEWLGKWALLNADEGCSCSLFGALAPSLVATGGGRVLWYSHVVPASLQCRVEADRRQLWDKACAMVGLDSNWPSSTAKPNQHQHAE